MNTTLHELSKPDNAMTWLAALVERKSQSEASRITGVSTTVISRVLSGKYDGNMDTVLAKIEQARNTEISRTALAGKVQFVPTHLAGEVFKQCDFTRILRGLNRIVGHSQIGKTTALEEYVKTHPDTYLITLYPETTMSSLIRMLAAAFGVKAHIARDLALRELAAPLTPNSLIIIDESHQVAYGNHGVKTMELLRALRDLAKCGVLLCGTYTLDAWMRRGVASDTLCQLTKRGTTAYLESYPHRADLDVIADSYNLPPLDDESNELALEFITREGLGPWCRELEYATYRITSAGKIPTWDLVVAVMDRSAHDRQVAYSN